MKIFNLRSISSFCFIVPAWGAVQGGESAPASPPVRPAKGLRGKVKSVYDWGKRTLGRQKKSPPGSPSADTFADSRQTLEDLSGFQTPESQVSDSPIFADRASTSSSSADEDLIWAEIDKAELAAAGRISPALTAAAEGKEIGGAGDVTPPAKPFGVAETGVPQLPAKPATLVRSPGVVTHFQPFDFAGIKTRRSLADYDLSRPSRPITKVYSPYERAFPAVLPGVLEEEYKGAPAGLPLTAPAAGEVPPPTLPAKTGEAGDMLKPGALDKKFGVTPPVTPTAEEAPAELPYHPPPRIMPQKIEAPMARQAQPFKPERTKKDPYPKMREEPLSLLAPRDEQF